LVKDQPRFKEKRNKPHFSMEEHHKHTEDGEIIDSYLWRPVTTAFLPQFYLKSYHYDYTNIFD
jgi:hypothetical protein